MDNVENSKEKPFPISYLFKELGYVDPCPNLGKWNKKAIKLRKEAKSKFNISQFKIGSYQEYEWDGYIKKPLYFYQGLYYG